MLNLGWQICDWRDEGEIHIVPTDDNEHERAQCWCSPEPNVLKDGLTVYVHNLIH